MHFHGKLALGLVQSLRRDTLAGGGTVATALLPYHAEKGCI
jgi:hypothetical protein